MTPRACLFLSVLLAAAAWAQTPTGTAPPPPTLEQALIASTNAVPAAQKSRDVEFLKGTLTADFLMVGSEGRLHDRREFLDGAHEGELKDY